MGISELLTSVFGAANEAGMVGSFLLRGALLLLVVLAISVTLRRAPAALRHHAWVLATVGLLAMPVLTVALPGWRVAVPVAAEAEAARTMPALAASRTAMEITHGVERPAPSGIDQAAASGEVPVAGEALTASTPMIPLGAVAFYAWLTGALLLATRLAIGIVAAARLARRAAPVDDRRWTVLVSLLSLKAGLGRTVRIVRSAEVDVPMAWGIFGAWLILPEEIDHWDEERRRVVVLHELAHLERRDCLVRALSQLALSIHWPNPLAWLSAARIAAERERACDDAVLAAGTRSATYARHLVDVARGLTRARPTVRAAVAMARLSDLEDRVVAILDARRPRGSLGRRAARLGVVALASLVLPLGLLRPVPAATIEAPEAGGPVAVEGLDEADTVEALESSPDVAAPDELTAQDAPSREASISLAAKVSARATASGMEVDFSARAAAGTTMPDTIEEKVYQALVKALTSDDPKLRRRAAETFGQMETPRAVAPLSRALSDSDDAVRRKAAWALGMIEDPGAVEALGDALRDANPATRKEIAWALGMIESREGVRFLTPLLADPETSLRKEAAWALGMIESSEAVEALTTAFAAEESARVRQEIVWALGMIEDRSAADTIVDAIEDPDPGVRDKALWALGMIMS